jgi:DNA-binding GntR family transcriptional regulator
LRERIQAGEIVSRLPSLTELTGQTGLAVGTVRRAVDVLVREHLVRTVPGRRQEPLHRRPVRRIVKSHQPLPRVGRQHRVHRRHRIPRRYWVLRAE